MHQSSVLPRLCFMISMWLASGACTALQRTVNLGLRVNQCHFYIIPFKPSVLLW